MRQVVVPHLADGVHGQEVSVALGYAAMLGGIVAAPVGDRAERRTQHEDGEPEHLQVLRGKRDFSF